jgi:hypothetical protein
VTAAAGDVQPKFDVVYSWPGVPEMKGGGTTASLDSTATGSLTAGTMKQETWPACPVLGLSASPALKAPVHVQSSIDRLTILDK